MEYINTFWTLTKKKCVYWNIRVDADACVGVDMCECVCMIGSGCTVLREGVDIRTN